MTEQSKTGQEKVLICGPVYAAVSDHRDVAALVAGAGVGVRSTYP